MRLPTLVSAILAGAATALASADQRVAPIYIQPVASSLQQPTLLAELAIPDPSTSSSSTSTTTPAEVLTYEAPDLDFPTDSSQQQQQQQQYQQLFRIGVYDPSARQWLSSTSVLSAANFDKGYAPHFVVSADAAGNYLGVLCRGVRIDAGQTRDFGPQAVVVTTEKGPQPALGKPVVLDPEGRKVQVEEKGFLQKYWWALAIGAFLLLSGGGGQD
ncbi:hypothetical protein MFIFM68171_03183 [Madurella fahalii]|uniref:Cyclin-dependent protein kinase regulator pho80 n=1 Tax=Madurella fahalii TaxID=1157608 RepID=A0ABQ0G5E9_9PEZI